MKPRNQFIFRVLFFAFLAQTQLVSAAITYVGSGTFAESANANVTPALAPGHAANDVNLVLAGFETAAGTMSIAGYTQLFLQSSSTSKLYLFCKVDSGSESNPTVVISGGASGNSVLAKAYTIRGAVTSCANIVAHSVGQINSTGDLTVEYPSLAVTTANTFVAIAYLHAENNLNGDSTPAGFTDTGYVQTGLGSDQSLNLKYQIQTAATNITAGAITINGSQANVSKSIVIALKQAPGASLLISDGFEGASVDTSKWILSDDGQAVHSQVASPVAREGGKSHRCNLTYNTAADFRCELSLKRSAYPMQAFFQDQWFGFSVYVPTQASLKSCIAAQWHGYGKFPGTPDENDTVKNPPLALIGPDSGNWKIQGLSSPSQPTLDTEKVAAFPTTVIAPVAFDQWTDFVFHIVWDYRSQPNGNGLVQVWVNGVLRLDKQRVSIGYNDAEVPYFKIGEYCSSFTIAAQAPPVGTVRTIFHDAFRYAGPTGSYSAVAPGQ